MSCDQKLCSFRFQTRQKEKHDAVSKFVTTSFHPVKSGQTWWWRLSGSLFWMCLSVQRVAPKAGASHINSHRMSKWGDRLKKVEQLAQSFQLHPLATRYKPRLCQPSSVWRLFPRQSLAISFAQGCKEVTTPDLVDAGQSVAQIWHLISRWATCWCLWLAVFRLCMFLHLKRKRPFWVKGSSWLPVTVSCGTTTGKTLYLRGLLEKMLPTDLVAICRFQDLHPVLDALLWGDPRGCCV